MKKSLFLLSFASLILLQFSLSAQPTITSFTPTSGPIGTSVVITGTNFNATAANNTVYFGAVKATVTSASATSINATVPAGANNHPITVTTGGLTGYSGKPFVVTFSGASAFGSTSFSNSFDFTTQSDLNDVAVGDLDGDGKTDLVVTNYGGGSGSSISVFRNVSTPGTISMASRQDFTTPVSPIDVSITDVDGDGKQDIAVLLINGMNLSIFRNTSSVGTISFAARVDILSISSIYSGTAPHLTAGDIDLDGKTDFVVSSATTLNIVRNTSSIGVVSFAPSFTINTTTISDVSCGDLDGDGKLDLALTLYSDNLVSTYLNTSTPGSLSFAPKVDFSVGSNPFGVLIYDFDQDGKNDMMVSNAVASNAVVTAFKNTSSIGATSFAAKVDFTSGYYFIVGSAADMDGDGKPDLLSVSPGQGYAIIFKNISTVGSPSIAPPYFIPTSPTDITGPVIADLDNDGKLDLAIGSTSASKLQIIRNRINEPAIASFSPTTAATGAVVTIIGSNFTGSTVVTFSGVAATSFTVASPTTITAVVPANSSGSVVVTSPYGSDTKTGFTFIPPPSITSFSPTSGTIGTSVTITGSNFTGTTSVIFGGVPAASFVVNSPTSITAIVDVAGDNTVGVVTPGGTASNGAFNFFLTTPMITSFSPTSGAVGSSVAITGSNFSATAVNNIVYFGSVRAVVTAATATSLTVTVPSGSTYSPISVTTGNLTTYSVNPFDVTFTGIAFAANSFDQGVAFSTGSYPQKPAIADLDNDGKPEIIFANNNSNSFSIIPNTGGSGVIALGNKIDVATSAGTSTVSPGDLDGDGKLEIVTSISGTITAYRNTSTSGISFTSISNVGFIGISGPFTILIQDLDGDGRPEVIATGNNSVSVFRNISSNSALSFSGPFNFPINGLAANLSSGDVDGDGKPDIALTSSGDLFSILRNTSTLGSISFAPRVDIAAGSMPYGIALADFDNDGKLDVVTNSNLAPNTTVSIFKNMSSSGSISFGVKQDIPTPVTSVKINTGDIDGDGKVDLFTSSGAYLLHNTSVGAVISFDSPITYSNMGGTDIALGDMDGNGKLDVVMVSTSGSYLFRNQINEPIITSFSPHIAGPGTVVTINGFNLDLATISFGGIPAASVTTISSTQTTAVVGSGSSGQLKVVTPTGATVADGFRFVTGPIISSFTPMKGVPGTTVTINGTGFSSTASNNLVRFGTTLAQITSSSTTQLVVTLPAGAIVAPITVTNGNLTGTSNQTFISTSSKQTTLTTATFVKSDVTIASNPQAMATGDFDDDGKPDLAVINGTDLVSVFGNTSGVGNATIGTGIDLTTGSTPVAIATGDFNLDGKLDIAVTNSGASTVSVFKNTSSSGAISFAAKADFTVATNPQGIAVGDLDGDARPDIVTANYTGSNLISVIMNSAVGDGNISFAAKSDFTAGSFPTDVAISDLNGDGDAELIVTNGSGGTATIFTSTIASGVITFQAKATISTGGSPFSVAVGDLTGDGWTDFVVANNGSSNVVVFKNPGNGTLAFYASSNYTTANSPWDVALGDMNGDGIPDVNVACSSGNVISTLINTSGNLSPKIDYAVGTSPYGVVAVDFDGDGTTDLASVNNTGNSVSLLRNNLPSITSFSPLTAGAGTTVTITGSNFSNISSVSFGGFTATSFNVVSATSVTAVVPSFANSGNVTITNPAGSVSLSGFVFVPKPSISSFTPTTAATGATVTIIGLNLTGITSVTFGETAAASFNVVSATSVTAVVGNGSTGAVSITSPGGTFTFSGFTFLQPPTVTSFSPAIGGPGMTITLTGTNFTGATAVSFGEVAATSFTIVSGTTIQAILATGASGDISVTTPGGIGKISDFVYDDKVTAIEPKSSGIDDLEIFPNPAKGQEINLKLNESWWGKSAELSITSISGSQAYSTSITCASTATVVLAQNSSLKPGMYIITVASEQKSARAKLIVIE